MQIRIIKYTKHFETSWINVIEKKTRRLKTKEIRIIIQS